MNNKPSNNDEADTLAFIDESGAGGYSRRLTPARDEELGLICALLVPSACSKTFRGEFHSGYKRFWDAMPIGAKPHITDAFAPGNEMWAAVARSVRTEYFQLVHRLKIYVIFEARRLRVDRMSHNFRENLVLRARQQASSRTRSSYRPSQSRVEDEIIVGLALKLDAFCEDFGRRKVDLLFDELDKSLRERYTNAVDRTRYIAKCGPPMTDRDSEAPSQVRGKIFFEAKAPYRLNTQFLGDLSVKGKTDPLMLATDIVANSLYDHLGHLSTDAPLNEPSSIRDWPLEGSVYGVTENAIGDKI